MSTQLRPEIIHAAIQGFEAQKERLDVQIAELRAMLNGASPKTEAATQGGRRRRVSATEKPSEPVTTAPTKPKRKLSAAGRAAIVAALKKRWALKRAAG